MRITTIAPIAAAVLTLSSVLALSGCISYTSRPSGAVHAELGQTLNVGGPRVTPIEVLEDSRCPAGVQCVWAGQVRITARIDTGPGSETRELVLGKSVQVADGALVLREVLPAKLKDRTIYPEDYSFAFEFQGGI